MTEEIKISISGELTQEHIELIAKRVVEIISQGKKEEEKPINKVYSAKQIAKILGYNPNTVLKYLQSGILQGTKPGQQWIITQDQLNIFINNPNN
jgi:hypothetical protein